MFRKHVFHDQNDLPGSSAAMTVVGTPTKFDYGSGASTSGGSLYSHPSTPLDNANGMNSMDLKYGCGTEYIPHSRCVFVTARVTILLSMLFYIFSIDGVSFHS